MRRRLFAFLLAAALSAADAAAAAEPIARAELDPESGRVTVGQPITVTVEVLVPTFFRGAPKFPSLDVRDAIAIFEDRGVNLTRRIEGETWAGQTRRYAIYPQRPGSFEIASIPVEVVYQGAEGPRTASPPPVRFDAVLPPGAEGLDYFLATTKLELTRTFEPPPDTLRVGDAFAATLTVTVHDALSMVVPPQPPELIDGLAAYADPPVVRDEGGERGEAIVGTRIEKTTWVAEEPGEYRLPPVELVWWDVAAGRSRTSSVPGVELVVVAAPATEPAIALPPDELDEPAAATSGSRRALWGEIRRHAPAAAAIVAAVWLALRFVRRRLPRWREAAAERRRRRAVSEEAYFRRFVEAARCDDPASAWWTLTRWIARAGQGATVRGFAVRAGDETFTAEIERLDVRLFGRTAPEGDWTGARLVASATRVRKRLASQPAVAVALPGALNPRGASLR